MGSLCSFPRNEPIKQELIYQHRYGEINFQDIRGDICEETVDVIINPTNNQLSHRNGISKTLVERGGEIIQQESDKYLDAAEEDILNPGTVVITSAGDLKAKAILHVVHPVWIGGDHGEEKKLALGIKNALAKIEELGFESVAFPSLSGGMFGFPKEKGVDIMLHTILDFVHSTPAPRSLKVIKFVNGHTSFIKLMKKHLQKEFGTLEGKKVFSPVQIGTLEGKKIPSSMQMVKEGRNIHQDQLKEGDDEGLAFVETMAANVAV